jgi:predicted nuclease with TOPRIM domain
VKEKKLEGEIEAEKDEIKSLKAKLSHTEDELKEHQSELETLKKRGTVSRSVISLEPHAPSNRKIKKQ